MFHGCPAARRTSKNTDQMKTRTKPLNPLGNPPGAQAPMFGEARSNRHLLDVRDVRIHNIYLYIFENSAQCDLKTAHCVGIFMHSLSESACSCSIPLTPPRIKTYSMLNSFTFHWQFLGMTPAHAPKKCNKAKYVEWMDITWAPKPGLRQ